MHIINRLYLYLRKTCRILDQPPEQQRRHIWYRVKFRALFTTYCNTFDISMIPLEFHRVGKIRSQGIPWFRLIFVITVGFHQIIRIAAFNRYNTTTCIVSVDNGRKVQCNFRPWLTNYDSSHFTRKIPKNNWFMNPASYANSQTSICSMVSHVEIHYLQKCYSSDIDTVYPIYTYR